MALDDLERVAQQLAARAHPEQRYGAHPYTHHLAAVRAQLAAYGFDGEVAVAAWLHDVVEDTEVGIEDIRAEFGEVVARLVWAVTGIGPDRPARNQDAYTKIRAYPRAVVLKLADRIANMEAAAADNPGLWEMYRREYPQFRGSLESLLPGEPAVASMWQHLDDLYQDTTGR
ncbi:HD domain-containing protein [Nocardia crassostreae]|uniref:HD domain-containing protein n=1 Tax=Nocardia crassostreae TaxID=53428 RepID=UPI0008296C71|nr:HD domain-containing protein [Nocardia crassostreae]